MANQLNNLSKSKISLGQVGQMDEMGFAVNMDAYCREEEDDESDKSVASNHSNEPTSAHKRSFLKSSYRSDPFPNKTKVCALPYGA